MKQKKNDIYLCPICSGKLNKKYVCSHCNRDFAIDIAYSRKGELAPHLIEATDCIDNACGDFISQFYSGEHNIEYIGTIRDALVEVLTKSHGMNEYDLAPWILDAVGKPGQDGPPLDGKTKRPTPNQSLTVKTASREKVMITVSGGVVTEVVATGVFDLYLIDHDNIEADQDGSTAHARTPVTPDRILDSKGFSDALDVELSGYEKITSAEGG